MDSTARRIIGAAIAAAQIGEASVTIDVAGIPVTVHAMPEPDHDACPTRMQTIIALNHRPGLSHTPCK